ncbi:type IVa pilus pseudopilin TppA [Aeromonas veronii]|uniref:type IVa pilus pseudopilin TppA n=1 Tax=Aeromonas veronii TaxID=654 RepID=UPI001619F12E|nr:type IVa pilus pseudopilin TppA [Aeromonas veronii]EKP0306933.1 type IVa pilus pseudopilin TppA [Aeromonas veronii]MCF5882782.1 type IVa pilus pseudopilin TppA [Aeromonas veronii]MCS3834371.1 type IV pilus assembly protein PilE [Aeromonas veronii]
MIGYFRGFSLIELMIVIAIVAILGTIAYPAYQQYVLTSHRVEAKKMLLDAANRQETYFMDFNRYTSSAADLNISDDSESGFYHLVISAGTNTFILFATASGAQGSDSDCIIFSIDQDGTRSATRLGDTVNDACWN